MTTAILLITLLITNLEPPSAVVSNPVPRTLNRSPTPRKLSRMVTKNPYANIGMYKKRYFLQKRCVCVCAYLSIYIYIHMYVYIYISVCFGARL